MEDFGILYGHLAYFAAIWYTYVIVIWYIFPRFGMLYQEKSGNPGPNMFTHEISSCRHFLRRNGRTFIISRLDRLKIAIKLP
jgi:hypothetical protein